MKLSSSLDELNEQFKNHDKDYLSLMELCDQAVQAPKRSRNNKKKVRTKPGSTLYNSLINLVNFPLARMILINLQFASPLNFIHLMLLL